MITKGLHHVTALAASARRNVAFYATVLGLRLVKRTVNFDDPGTWHLYYGDESGSPGTILTFFPYEHAGPGRLGVGEGEETAFAVPSGSLDYWRERLAAKDVPVDPPSERFGEPRLLFTDPDGMRLALVEMTGIGGSTAWTVDGIPAEHAVRGFHSVTLHLEKSSPTAAILGGVLGFEEVAGEGRFVRYRVPDAGIGGIVDIHLSDGFFYGRQGAGSVHHVAFRAADDGEQAAIARRLAVDYGLHPTPQIDRDYFRAIYFREPGGLLFEIATDPPGFAVDEPLPELGRTLKLPARYQAHRREIEGRLPDLGL